MLPAAPEATSSAPAAAGFQLPLDRAAERPTKKVFGTYVTPKNSPVQPEQFSGFHTGLDFEILQGEPQGGEPVLAVCSGKLLQAKWVSGYGGVAIQSCTYRGSAVTVLYGHVRLASISAKVGQDIAAGQQIAVLGKGYTSETDNERTHLHLSIHSGTDVSLRGYVANREGLASWLDPAQVLSL
jgi:murein DD-endopeptidase MepM/ murein hydrolase activator NlpD